MTPGIMIGTLLSTALTVGAVAQSTGGQTPSQTGSFENLQFTATGCLQSVEAAGTTQTGGASAAGAAGSGASRGGGFVPHEREDRHGRKKRGCRRIEHRTGFVGLEGEHDEVQARGQRV